MSQTTTDSVSVTTVVTVDPERAFEIFTGEIDRWWRRGPRFRFSPAGDGELRFEPLAAGGRLIEVHGEGQTYEVGRVLAWEPGARLAFEFRARSFAPDLVTEVHVRFEPADGGTRVTLEHRGWDRIPADDRARGGLTASAFASLIGLWWAEQLTGLRH